MVSQYPIFDRFVEQGMAIQVMESSRQALMEVMKTLPPYSLCVKGVIEGMEEKTASLKEKVNAAVMLRLKREKEFFRPEEWKAISEKIRIKDALHLEYRKGGCRNIFSSRIPNTYEKEPGNLLLYQMVDPWVEARKREIRTVVGQKISVKEGEINKYLESKAVKHVSIKAIVCQIFTHYLSVNSQKKAQQKSSFKKRIERAPVEKWAGAIATFITEKMKDYEAFYLAEGGKQGDPTGAFSCKVTEFARDLVRPPKKTFTTMVDSISEESEDEKTVGRKTLSGEVSTAVTRYPEVSNKSVLNMAEGGIDRAIFTAFSSQIVVHFNERIGKIGQNVDPNFAGFLTLLQIQKCFEKIAFSQKSLAQQLKAKQDLGEKRVIDGLLFEIYCVRDGLKETYRMGTDTGIFFAIGGGEKNKASM